MNCYTSGIIGLGMLFATFSTMSVTEEQNNMLRNTFYPNLELVERYEKITIERRNLYFQGILLGLIISYFLLKSYNIINEFHKVTFVFSITLFVSVMYYFLMPKSDYMLKHLKTEKENRAWLHVYTFMRQRYFLGMLFGMLAAIPIAHAMC